MSEVTRLLEQVQPGEPLDPEEMIRRVLELDRPNGATRPVLLAAGRPGEAQRLCEKTLEALAASPDHLSYMSSRARRTLAKVHGQQGQFERAEAVLLEDYSTLSKFPAGFEHLKGLTSEALISLCQGWGRNPFRIPSRALSPSL